jgi:hypothetical protein
LYTSFHTQTTCTLYTDSDVFDNKRQSDNAITKDKPQ